MEIFKFMLNNITDGIFLQEVNCQNIPEDTPLSEKYPEVNKKFLEFGEKFDTPQKRYGMFQPIVISDNLVVCNSYSKMANTSNETLLINNLKRLNEYANKSNLTAYVPEYIGCEENPDDWSTIRDYIESHTNIQIL